MHAKMVGLVVYLLMPRCEETTDKLIPLVNELGVKIGVDEDTPVRHEYRR
jgi:hypothetical protein